jgi:adenylate cyclase
MKNKKLVHSLTLAGLIALVLSLFIGFFPSFTGFTEDSVRDFYFARQRNTPALSSVAIIGFDEKTLEHFEWKSKLEHKVHGQLVDRLTAMGAKAIAFDFAFLEENKKDPQQTLAFGESCKKSGKTVLGAIIAGEENGFAIIKRPVKGLLDSGTDLGILYHPLDKDSVIRRATLGFKSNDSNYFALALQAWLTSENIKDKDVSFSENSITIKNGVENLNIPIDDNGNIRIWYAGPEGTIPTYSYIDILNGTIPEDKIKDRVIFVGPTAKIFQDIRLVPTFSGQTGQANSMVGVEIHGQTYLTLAEGLMNDCNFLSETGLPFSVVIIFCCAIFTALVTALVPPIISWLFPPLAIVGFVLGAHHFIFINLLQIPPVLFPSITIVTTYISVLGYNFFIEQRQRKQVRSMFEHFLPAHVVKRLEDNPDLLQAPGHEQVLTVLFTDIRNFTPLSERLGAEQTVKLLNLYFEAMTKVLLENNGMIDKFIGDAILAVFGEPVSCDNHAIAAVKAAIEMRKALNKLNNDPLFQSIIGEDESLDTGIAINTGKMFVGNIGGPTRKDYTVIGDAVNLCSRLEGLAKGDNPRIILSLSTHNETKDIAKSVSIGLVKVKGISEPVEAFGIVMDGLGR